MSVWHIFQAGFSHLADPFLRSNSLLLLIYLIYCLEKKRLAAFCFCAGFGPFRAVTFSGFAGFGSFFNHCT